MIRKLLISMGSSVVCGAVVLAATMTKGMALDITFSFTNTSGNTSGTVTGVIYGLTANETNGTPTDIEITSYPTAINSGALSDLPTATETTPWDIFNDPSYSLSGSVSTNALGNITYNALSMIGKTNGNILSFYEGQATLSVLTSYSVIASNTYNTVQTTNPTYTGGGTPVPWSDPSGGSLPAIGAVLGIGVMRKAKQFQKAKVGSSQLEKV